MGKRIETIPRKTMETLQHYPWPGNVRELKNVIERAMIISKGVALNAEMPAFKESDRLYGATLKDVEKNHIIKVLKETGWRVKGKNGAAEILGLNPTTLHSRMKKLGIKRPS
jgi:transcriptional regulator with GAF, ATPase, and Fis domain